MITKNTGMIPTGISARAGFVGVVIGLIA